MILGKEKKHNEVRETVNGIEKTAELFYEMRGFSILQKKVNF